MPSAVSPPVLVVGQSRPGPCGVRDNANTLCEGLNRRGFQAAVLWFDRPRPRGLREAVRADIQTVRAIRERTTVGGTVIFHYSPFVFGYRGLPIAAPFLRAVLTRRGARTVTVLHELAFPWSGAGMRGLVWALGQRIALLPMLLSRGPVVVSTNERANWLRRWFRIPPSMLRIVPVWSSLPEPVAVVRVPNARLELCCFGWSAVQPAEQELALETVRHLVGDGLDVRLTLLGGAASSPALAQWQRVTTRLGLTDRVRITGPVPPEVASATLAGCDVYLHLDAAGPTSRKSSLAAALAMRAAVVANDGSQTWQEFRDNAAIKIVAPTASALASAVRRLLCDDAERSSLGDRGNRFYRERMAIDNGLDTYISVIDTGDHREDRRASRSSTGRV